MTPTEGTASAVLAIDLDAIAANWRDLVRRHPSGPVAAVVKADAYGLGAAPVARRLIAEGARHVFVATLEEALALRAVVPRAVLLGVLNGLVAGAEAEAAASGIVPVLNEPAALERWRACAAARSERLPAILQIDTGMNRLGLGRREVERVAQDPAAFAALDLRYVMTHFVASEEPENPLNREQVRRFDALRAMLPPVPTSVANSSGIFLGPLAASDLARPGAALYGINPTPGHPNPMRTAVTLEARILQVRDIEAGESVGYNSTWVAARPARIATVAAGYADGYLRSLSGRGVGLVAGRQVPLAGRVSMDLLTFDVTDAPEAAAGGWVRLLGPDLPPDAVAERAGTNAYEILTALGARYRRYYRGQA
ncbi:alanine racemase [Elioraea sp. Yellowstone]|jgi:alanine racemase|uniref:alanine racemase n=1 Tax=Elioraea sp. Yellowstone TaxID=2592070 RepID=UPI0011544438|nr:alanine racemase [Elioraea sp. Yellowstone]TQF77928.1 alanine racemase [Elioraea sp. Yellowstone]